jgi:hypothetical protein
MIPSIIFHALLGLGGTCAGICGRKFCRCRSHALSLTLLLVAIEAVVAVAVLDPLMSKWTGGH